MTKLTTIRHPARALHKRLGNKWWKRLKSYAGLAFLALMMTLLVSLAVSKDRDQHYLDTKGTLTSAIITQRKAWPGHRSSPPSYQLQVSFTDQNSKKQSTWIEVVKDDYTWGRVGYPIDIRYDPLDPMHAKPDYDMDNWGSVRYIGGFVLALLFLFVIGLIVEFTV